MTFKLKMLNVVKVTDSEAARDGLIAQGFTDVTGVKVTPAAPAAADEQEAAAPAAADEQEAAAPKRTARRAKAR